MSKWIKITGTPLEAKWREISGGPELPLRTEEWTEVKALKLLLSDSFIESAILTPINQHLYLKRSDQQWAAKKGHDMDTNDFWKFFVLWLDDMINHKKGRGYEHNSVTGSNVPLMAKNRLKIIHSSLNFSTQELQAFLVKMRVQIQSVWKLPSTLTTDEIIFIHHSLQSSVDGVFQLMPNKPHSKGLLCWTTAAVGPISRLPYLIDLVPKLDEQAPTPSDALKQMVKRVAERSSYPVHFIADNAFHGVETTNWVSRTRCLVTVGLSSSPSCGAAELFNLATTNLKAGKTRTFSRGSLISQFKNNGKLRYGAVSNAFRILRQTTEQRSTPHPCTYKEASQHLLGLSLDTLHNILAPPGTLYENAFDIIRDRTGWDLTRPDPDVYSTLNEESLGSMTMKQLKRLEKEVEGIPHTKRKKEELIEVILANHPEVRQDEETEEVSVQKQLAELMEQGDNDELVSRYGDFFNSIDRYNRLYYSFTAIAHIGWRKVFLLSFLSIIVLDAYIFYTEIQLARQTARTGHLLAGTSVKDQMASLSSFVKVIISNIEKEIAKK